MWMLHHWHSQKSETSFLVWKSRLHQHRDNRLQKLKNKPRNNHNWRQPLQELLTNMVTKLFLRQLATTKRRRSRQKQNGVSELSLRQTCICVPTISMCRLRILKKRDIHIFCPKTCLRSSSPYPILGARYVSIVFQNKTIYLLNVFI